ncbi:MAG: c-type cytochrome [Verrucomicrobia bacterium]|nr:c-type cytochrome [Verrucomicrobiota bacterium]MBI3867989.1 c-type cytochrome [Verrucomicrobiota bacterium]
MHPFRFLSNALAIAAIAVTTARSANAAAPDPFAEGVRPTPWLAPEDSRRSLHVPSGFEIQLVASEPGISKPMNMAFDAQGRLWLSTTVEYPFPAPTNAPGRDRILVLEDFGPDGHARKITEFAGGLNIPIGIYPFHSRNPDGRTTWKAIAWSIPHIWLFEDTDGDGRADRREILYANFDFTRDTHGNQASFRRGFDGWIYCTHGYNNDSHVHGRDGHEVHMNSGNTYRARIDGSRVEQFTHGQVNPFGMAFDPAGDLFTSDCHSEPIYQVLRGGYYPSFGKPHDGLGFAPKMMQNKRGSTALDGLSIYSDVLWPEEFRGNIFIGDVMTSRVYRDRVTEAGSTRLAWAMPDLVISDDPWFRPVDTQLGPDGSLYIADFYNKIIGHYEVPLTHPGRDRTSGRIWRVVRRGAGEPRGERPMPDLTAMSAQELTASLASPSLITRRLATDELTDRWGVDAIPALRQALRKPVNGAQEAHLLWALHRVGALDPRDLDRAARSADRLTRTHAMRMLAELPELTSAQLRQARGALSDTDALVRRCAADALGRHPSADNAVALMRRLEECPSEDTHLRYVLRQSLRDQLIPEENLRRVVAGNLTEARREQVSDLALSVNTEASASYLLSRLATWPVAASNVARIAEVIRHVARYAPEKRLPDIMSFAETRLASGGGESSMKSFEGPLAWFRALDDGLQERGVSQPASVRFWGSNLVARFFASVRPYHSWSPLPYDPEPTLNAWGMESLDCADGAKRNLTSSASYGEELTGVLRSSFFKAPDRLHFWLAGHDGPPRNPPQRLNRIRLCLHPSGRVLIETPAPRSSKAVGIDWNLSEFKGADVYIEAIDGDDSSEFAWIAFGGFEPNLPALEASEFSPRQFIDWITAASDIATRVEMRGLSPTLGALLDFASAPAAVMGDPECVGAVARAWLTLAPSEAMARLSGALKDPRTSGYFRERVASLLASRNDALAQQAVLDAMKGLPQRAQERLAALLASSPFSAETLLSGMENGAISPRVLQRVGVNNRLRASKPARWEERVARLKKQFPPADDARDSLIAQYRKAVSETPGDGARGRAVFLKHCAVCHRIGSEGALIAPQLDGIGQRGPDRLCEDVLDPNRSVDIGFRTVMLTLKDGDVASGLFRREEGETLILADSAGKEFSTPKSRIAERRTLETSLMPENFGEILKAEEFLDLMAFLMSTAAKR